MTCFKRVFQDKFARSVILLSSATAIAHAITALTLPIITRVYSPADFTVSAVFISIVQLISVAAGLRYEVAINIPERDEDAANILAIAISNVTLVSLITTMLASLWSEEIAKLLNQPLLQNYLWLVPIGVFMVGSYTVLQFWAVRKKEFILIAKTHIVQSFISAGVQIGFGLFKVGPVGLMAGHIFQQGSGSLSLVIKAIVSDRELLSKITLSNMKEMAKEYIRYPKYSVAESIAQTAGLQLPFVIIGALAIGSEAGFLMLASRVMQLPVSLIGASMAQLFTSEASNAMRCNSLASFTAHGVGRILKVTCGPILFIGITAPLLFSHLFGLAWERAGELASWLTLATIFQIMASSISIIFYVTNNQKLALNLQLLGVFFRLGVLLLVMKYEPNFTSETYAISGFLFYFIYFIFLLRCASVTFRSLLLQIRYSAVYIVLWIVFGLLINTFTNSNFEFDLPEIEFDYFFNRLLEKFPMIINNTAQ